MYSNSFPQESRLGKCSKMLPQWNTWTSFTSRRKKSSMRELQHLHMRGDCRLHWIGALGIQTFIMPSSMKGFGPALVGMGKVPHFCCSSKAYITLATTCPIPLDPTRTLITQVLPSLCQRMLDPCVDASPFSRVLSWPNSCGR